MQVASILNKEADKLKLTDFFNQVEYEPSEEMIRLFTEEQAEQSATSQMQLSMEQRISQGIWRAHKASAQRVFEKQKTQQR